MIGFIEGKVVWSEGDLVCVQTGGVGYVVKVANLAETVEGVSSYFVSHVVREDSESLYGFSSLLEKQIFDILIGVSGVGPSLALAALRKFSPGALLKVVRSKDLNSLCSIPGVGKKTGERLMVDLNSKFEGKEFLDLNETNEGGRTSESEDAYEVLLQFGFSPGDIRKALTSVDNVDGVDGVDSVNASSLVVEALKILKEKK